MHGFTRAVERRLKALELLVGSITTTETAAETARRLTLCRAALRGETPGDLDDGERLTFPKIVASVPILQELLDEGALDGYLDGDGRSLDGDGQELAWSP